MKILIALAIFTILLLWYTLQGRAWLKAKPWAQGFFTWVEPAEIVLFKKSETILFARLKVFTGLLLALLTNVGTIDISPIVPLVPEKYQGWIHGAFNLMPLLLSIVGWMDERLRNQTTLPVEMVAVSNKTIAENPKVAEAVAMAVATKTEAVAVVTEAKKAA